MVTIIVNAGTATIIANTNNEKVSIMNYDAVTSQDIEDFEDNESIEDVEKFKRDSVGCYYQEQGNI